MKTSELADKLRELMRDTGKGDRDILILTPEGVENVTGVVFDEENNVFFLKIEWID